MPTVERSIEVHVPVHTAYNQWTQFEEFPRFMQGVDRVKQIDDKRLFWKATIAGKQKEWNAEITEQTPDNRVAWKSTDGATNAGAVTFHRIDDEHTRVMLQLEYEPEGVIEGAGAALGIVERRVNGDLKHFKEFIEKRGSETGAWRGEIKQKAK